MKKITMLSLMAALTGLSLAAWAEPGDPRGGGRSERSGRMHGEGGPGAGQEHMIERLLNQPDKLGELGLTEKQVAELKAGFYETEKKMVKLNGDLELAQIELRRLMEAEEPDGAAILAAVDKAGLARTAIQKAKVEQGLAVRKILGPETLKKIKVDAGERLRRERGPDEGKRGPHGPAGEGRRAEKGAPRQQDEMEPPPEE